MSTSNVNTATRKVRTAQLIAGIGKYFLSMPTIVLGRTRYTPASLIARLQEVLDAIGRSAGSKAAWLAAVQIERNLIAATAPLERYLKAFVVTQFGDTQDSARELADFGYSPRRVGSKNVEVKALAADKVRATRAARGTKGPKQRAKIKGSPKVEPASGPPAASHPRRAP